MLRGISELGKPSWKRIRREKVLAINFTLQREREREREAGGEGEKIERWEKGSKEGERGGGREAREGGGEREERKRGRGERIGKRGRPPVTSFLTATVTHLRSLWPASH